MRAPRPPQAGAPAFAGIILAAGRSRRMRGGRKLLRQLHGVAVVRRVAATALEADLDPVVVVTGQDAGGIRRALAGLEVRFVSAPAERAGRLTSVTTGIEALLRMERAAAGAVILLGDEPGVKAEHVAAVRAAAGPARVSSRAAYRDREGHPVVVPAETLALIPSLARRYAPESRLWDLLLDHDAPCRTVPIGEQAPIDIDTETDLARAAELDRGR